MRILGNRRDTPLAAVDLGSNSFHMIVAKPMDGHLHVMDRMREMVRLAAGLDEQNRLGEEARERALECLRRFGQRLREMPRGTVRAVGTNTLRKARDAENFLEEAEDALGHPIEVISGLEEARLIYLGVAHGLPETEGARLVIDIGGGSTELIIGRDFEPLEMESLYMGCISATRRHFGEGGLERGFDRAVLAARMELEPVAVTFRELGWSAAVGASGTVRAVASVAQANGWCEEGITREAMEAVRRAIAEAGSHKGLRKLKGLKAERVPVFAGGAAVLYALFQDLGIERMVVSDWALREGLLYDQLGRIRHEDVRERTIAAVTGRHRLDQKQGRRVEETVLLLLEQAAEPWGLEDDESRNLVAWGARLHEVGMAIAHAQHHKHGAYVVANADMPGFSRQEQRRLACLIRGHRRKFPQSTIRELPEEERQSIRRLCALLRLAVLLHRSRTDAGLPDLCLRVKEDVLELQLEDGWLADHPLTRADLAQEAELLKAGGFSLRFE